MMDSPPDITGFSTYFRAGVTESPDPKTGQVSGIFPKWLKGTLYRNGPGQMEVGQDKYNHWFDGLSMIHKFDVSDGNPTYQNKLLQSETYRENIKANRIVVSEFGTQAYPDPCATLFERVSSIFTRIATDNANINIVEYGDSLYAVSDFDRITKVDKNTLETMEREEIGKYVSVNLATVHPHYDKDGSVYNLGNGFTNGISTDLLIKFPAKPSPGKTPFEEAQIISKIRCASLLAPSYHHSFTMTDNYVIIIDQSFAMDLGTLACAMIRKKAYGAGLQYRPNRKVLIKVVDKVTGKILPNKFTSDPFLTFHQVNGYEEDGHAVVDVVTYQDNSYVDAFFRTSAEDVIKNPEKILTLKTQVARFVLPLRDPSECKVYPNSGLVSLKNTTASARVDKDGNIYCQPEILSEKLDSFELPQINYASFNGKKYKYCYGIARTVGDLVQGIVKLNVDDHSILEWKSSEEGVLPSEPTFIQSPGATDEDDGVLLFSALHTTDNNKVTLVCLDAKTMTQVASAEFSTGTVIPNVTHGRFLRQ